MKQTSSVFRNLGRYLVRLAFPALILAAGVAAFSVLSNNPEEKEETRQEERQIRTRVTELRVQDYPVIVTAQGTVRSHNEISLSAQVSGQIINVSPKFEAGSHFSKGDVLVELDPGDYKIAVAIAEARIKDVKSELEVAEAEFASYTTLHSRDFVSESEMNRYAATRDQAAAQLESAAAQLEQAELDLERTTIRAPFDGRVRTKNVGLGQSIGSGTTLGVIFAVDYAEVRLPISAKDRRYLQLPEVEGAPHVPVILSDAIHPDNEIVWHAQIVRTEGMLDEGSLDLVAIARIDDPFGLRTGRPPLRIGQPVTGRVRGEMLTNVIAIPRPAVRELDQIILIDESDLRLTRVTVQPIWSDQDSIIVPDSEIYENMLLATTHIVYAPEGAQVEIIPEIDDSEPAMGDVEDSGA